MVANNNLVRQRSIREKIKKVSNGRYRLSVFRSKKNIYAQIIDDSKGKTLISSSTLDKDVKSKDGTQPKKYYKDLKKGTKDKRANFFKKQSGYKKF